MTTKSGSGPSIARLCAAAIFSCLSLARRLALAFPTALDDTGGEGFTVGCCPLVTCGPTVHSYSLKCVEGEFCELRPNGVLRSSHIRPSAKSINFNACNYLIIPDDIRSPSGSLAYRGGAMQEFIAHTLWSC